MRVIGENDSAFRKRYPGLYEWRKGIVKEVNLAQDSNTPANHSIPEPTPSPKQKKSLGERYDAFMKRHPRWFIPPTDSKEPHRVQYNHIHAGPINRISLCAGDIFIDHNDSLSHNSLIIPQLLTGSKYAAFGHAGIVVSTTHVVHIVTTDSPNSVAMQTIDHAFNAKREYRIFRPVNPSIAQTIVEVALDLVENRYIPYSGRLLPGNVSFGTFLKIGLKHKGNRTLTRFFFGKGHQVANDERIRAEYNALLGVREIGFLEQMDELEDILEKWIASGLLKRDNLKDQLLMKTYRERMADVYSSKKNGKIKPIHFHCAQFVCWITQFAVCLLREREPDYKEQIADIMPLRHSKAIPSRLVEVLKSSKHFVEFKSQESYKTPLKTPTFLPGALYRDDPRPPQAKVEVNSGWNNARLQFKEMEEDTLSLNSQDSFYADAVVVIGKIDNSADDELIDRLSIRSGKYPAPLAPQPFQRKMNAFRTKGKRPAPPPPQSSKYLHNPDDDELYALLSD